MQPLPLEGCILITGCSSGIGRALAEAFIKRGRHVVPTARRLESISDLECSNCTPMTLDVTDEASIEEAVTRAEACQGGIGTLINNAGWGLMGPVAEISSEDLRRQLDANLVGPIALISRVLPAMVRRHTGKIVNIGSVSGLVATPFAGAYCGSKAALHSMTDSLRLEVAPLGISVVCVQAGAVRSSFGETASSNLMESVRKNSLFSDHAPTIRERARASDRKGMDAAAFAEIVAAKLERDPPPPVIRLGPLSGKMSLLRLLPTSLRDRVLSKKFGLRSRLR